MSLDYSRLCLYLLNWRGICGPTVGHATRQQQTTAENSCVPSSFDIGVHVHISTQYVLRRRLLLPSEC